MRAVAYIRVSTDDQAKEGYSLLFQEEQIKEYITKNKYTYCKTFCDDGYSGYNIQRPALQKLLKDAKEKQFDIILVWKIDRFSRKAKDLLNIVDELQTYGIAFKSITEPFDTTASAGKLMFQLLGSFAEFERNKIKERVIPGMIEATKKGFWQGGKQAPYGYKYDKKEKNLIPVLDEIEVVKFCFNSAFNNITGTQIAKELKKRGVKSRNGKRFYPALVYNILRNQTYIGNIVWNKKHYDTNKKVGKYYKYIKNPKELWKIAKGRHEPIIEPYIFEAVQKKLDENRIKRMPARHPRSYLLTGVLYCGYCGQKMRGSSAICNHKTREKDRWYTCQSRYQEDINCKNKGIRSKYIETVIIEIINTILKKDKIFVEAQKDYLTKSKLSEEHAEKREDLSIAKMELMGNRKKQKELLELYEERIITKDLLKIHIEELRLLEIEINKKINMLKSVILEKENSPQYLELVNRAISEKEKDAINLKDIITIMIKRIEVKDKVINKLEFHKPFDKIFEKEQNECINKEIEKSLADLSTSDAQRIL